MVCSGLYRKISGNDVDEYSILYKADKKDIIVYLGKNNNLVSAYKIKDTKRYAFRNKDAESVYEFIKTANQGATSKNGTPVPFKYGAASMHYFKKRNIDYEVQKFNGEIVHLSVSAVGFNISLNFYEGNFNEVDLDYTEIKSESISNVSSDDIPVRSLAEIALEKDITWLKDKKYYIVNDNETAERLFSQLEQYKGIVCLDYETTGLKINMFGQYGSKRRAELEKYNLEHPDSPIRTDSLVGLIFCVEDNVSYYFPVGHRKFDNLYSKFDDICIKTIQNIKARYTVGDLRDKDTEYAKFIRELKESDFTPDIILMERVRNILEKCNILAHNGSFEYKVSLLYEIDLNLKEDTMLMHQLMYKFRSTTSNKGEPSNLKYLTFVEFGVNQLDLKDFFVDYKEDSKGTVRNIKAQTIDFSYMDYEGTKAYGPPDGDFTLKIYKKYKKDLTTKFKDMEYLYNVEVIVAMAIGYAEFYGLRIDEEKIEKAKNKSIEDMLLLEHKIRKLANYTTPKEDEIFDSLIVAMSDDNSAKELKQSLFDDLRTEIDASDKVLNLNSPAQVSSLFYDILGYPCKDGDRSVGKKVIKGLTKAKNADGSPKYPAVGLYREYKDLSSLLTKFFGKLPDFMYPGGFFFSSFGQISTATGRMSCLDEDTLITTVGGVKKIKDVKVGDLVYCYDDNGDIRIRPVLNVIYKGYKDCIELKWRSSGSNKTGSLVCTPEHKIKTKEFGWVEAKDCLDKKVYHLHRSDKDRPRLFGTNSFYEQEQLTIKREYFGIQSYNDVIHHKDGNTRNNCIENLEIKERSVHSREHTKELLASGKIKYEHLIGAEHRVLKGKEHPCYIDLSSEELTNMIIEANGVLTKIDMDFDTFKKKCNEKGVDYDLIVKSILTGKRDISDDEFRNAYAVCSGVTLRIANYLGISRWRVDKIKRELGLSNFSYNIDVCSYSSDFYTLKGDIHTLMLKYDISYKDCLNINKSLGLVFIGISDEDFIDSFFRNKGVIRSIGKELGMTWYKVKSTIERLGLCYNHSIYSIEPFGKRNVYDLEIDGIHNFIANEICVHNCSRPNAQQLPKSVTKIIVPRDNFIIADADFSQIEYRTMTALARETHLIEQFSDPDSDFHTIMASVMFQIPYASVSPDMRSSAKSFNFGIPYGMGFKSLSILLFGDSTPEHVEEAKRLYELYFKDQPNIRKFFERAKETASVYKYNTTHFNRVRAYSFMDANGNYSEAKKAMALRQAGNFIIQGCLSGDTIIQTKEYGFTKISDVANCGERLHVWDGKDWTKGDVLYSGKKKKCIITLNDDRQIVCSPNHKFLVVSHKGNTRFVECKDLHGKDLHSSPHRIVINGEYSPSDYKYSSDWARCFATNNKQAHNYFVDNIKNSFDAGVMLGRLASDGSIFLRKPELSSSIRHIFAEHEFSIIPYMEKIMSCYKFVSKVNPLREDRNQRMAYLNVFSTSLTAEVENLDIKHTIDSDMAKDTEMLRGFLRGMFDGDGGFMGETIGLTFGWQFDFEPLCREIQRYLLMFGIRSYYDRVDGIKHLIRIRKADNIKFLDTIGFINEAKNNRGYKCVASKKEKVFGRSLYVESVEITDEEIDMYDVCNTDRGYFVADGVITHNSSADIFKIAIARNFSFIRKYKLFGKILITNLVHDEMLYELDCNCLNIKKVLSEIIKNMEFKLDGFPPLYVGAGVDMSWASAKGKMAEIHPVLADTFIKESENDSIYVAEPNKNIDIKNYFDNRVYEFRVNKIIDYLKDENNHNKEVSPIIGNLLSLQFDYGVNKEFESEYTEDNGYTKSEIDLHKKNIPLEQLKRFIADKEVDIDISLFKGATLEIEEEVDVAYEDGEDDIDEDEFDSGSSHVFALIEEDTSKFGISIQDLINQFGLVVSTELSMCGIDLKKVRKDKKEELYKLIEEHECLYDDEGSLRVVFLGNNNNLIRTDVYVNNLKTSDVADRLSIHTLIA